MSCATDAAFGISRMSVKSLLIPSKQLDLAVGQLAPLDVRGRADTFDGSDPAQRVQSLWGDDPKARQAPLDSSISDRTSRRSAVISMVFTASIPVYMPDYTGFVYRRTYRIMPN